jgi:L-threonylcarbamoyladenylate synthase
VAAKVVSVSGTHPDASVVARATEVLASGRLVIYPTDTLYAIGGRALDPRAVRAVRSAKGRAAGKPLPVVAADLDQARSLCADWPPEAQALAERFWPGPFTLVLNGAAKVPAELGGGLGTIAVRVPALELARALCRAAGPLVSTSANRAGAPPPVTCADAVEAVGASAALALDGGTGRSAASTLVDLTAEPVLLLRAGAVPWAEIEGVLRSHGR